MTLVKPAAGGRRRTVGPKAIIIPLFAGAVAVISTVSPVAFADHAGWYEPDELQTSCVQPVDGLGRADRCRFEPWSKENFTDGIERASSEILNCTNRASRMELAWSTSRTETSSIQVSAEVQAELTKIWSASITTTYGRPWLYMTRESGREPVTIDPYHVGWIERGVPMQRVTGRMVHNYPKPRHGHFEWYTYPTLTAADPDARGYEHISFQSRPMTQSEIAERCASGPPSNGLSGAPARR